MLTGSLTNGISVQSFAQKKKIHFVGIGGIGMSAQAMYEHFSGNTVSGSDPYSSER
ncbi:MAG: Mur ligase domain-containing protein, partial [Fervidobacterium sp.]